MAKKKKTNKSGRPLKMTARIIEKLEEAFARGSSDSEACILAEIGERTLYDYCKQHTSFRTKKELLKQTPSIRAKNNIVKALEEGNLKLSMWWLEHKSNEFKKRIDVVTGNMPLASGTIIRLPYNSRRDKNQSGVMN